MKARFDRERYSFPKIGLLLSFPTRHGSLGIGLGCSYYQDGHIDVGLYLGKRYYCLNIMWGEAEQADNEVRALVKPKTYSNLNYVKPMSVEDV